MGVHNIQNQATFEEAKAKAKDGKILVLDAFATWCGPCKVIAPVIAKWSEQDQSAAEADKTGETGKFHHVDFVKVDVDELPTIAQELQVNAMPTFIIFKDNEPVDKVVGANQRALAEVIERYAGKAPERKAAE